MALLEVDDLNVSIHRSKILRGVTLQVEQGETLGIVGESGCGKSMTGLAVMGMLPHSAVVKQGEIRLEGRNLVGLPEREWLDIRGQEISMVMQDPFTSLNPMMRVGDQIGEVYRLHRGYSKERARQEAVEMIRQVGVPDPESSARKYPHQMSGGQRQRIVIAIAFASRPKVLIADEPTTALDVTLQAQILRLLRQLQEQAGTAVILISHDIGVIGAMSHRVAVYYAGRVVECGSVEQVLHNPSHPYTQALLNSMPERGTGRLQVISGQPPQLDSLGDECAFAPRCPLRFEKCDVDPPLFQVGSGHESACWKAEQLAHSPNIEA